MITLVVGHRGTGKSDLLRRLKSYYEDAGQSVILFDLDARIEENEGRSITELFQDVGEARFREIESRCLHELVAGLNSRREIGEFEAYIAVGAGYSGSLPKGTRCLWIRRPTDVNGRVFSNRPRLAPHLSPMDEFKARFDERERRYAAWADDVFMLSEGYGYPNVAERRYFMNSISDLGAALTVAPSDVRSIDAGERFIARRATWGLRYFELRDDWFGHEEFDRALALLTGKPILFSFRASGEAAERRRERWAKVIRQGYAWDWALELGSIDSVLRSLGMPTFVSLHERHAGESVEEALRRLEVNGRDSHLKAALEIGNFQDLCLGHEWMMADPGRRCFLPRSSDGRWAWYRLLMKGRMPLHFIREGSGSCADQPTLFDWLICPEGVNGFAAILGDPVLHSRTPAEQGPFFGARGLPVLRVKVSEEEWDSGALDILRRLGLRYAAVTAPLKRKAWSACRRTSGEAGRYQSANTLTWSDSENAWHGDNTDSAGLKSLLRTALIDMPAVVWGGGGTLPVLQDVLPNAWFYSARSGDIRKGTNQGHDGLKPERPLHPQAVIWAVDRSRPFQWPPETWRPSVVVDLNYSESSPALEYALKNGARYVSGLHMFTAQAAEQRKIWGQDGRE